MNNYPDIYFLPEWGDLYQEHDKGVVDRFEFKNELGHIYYQFMKRQLPEDLDLGSYCDIVTPYGFNGPVILESDQGSKLILIAEYDKEFQKYCIDNNIISEYIRFNPWLKNHLDFEKIYTTKYNNYTLYTDLTVNDFFMQEFSSKIRNLIRKAVKSGIQIEFDFSGATITEFYRLYQMMVEKNKVADYYIFKSDFLKKTFLSLKDKQFIINAVYEDKYISSAIFLHYGDYIHYHLSANDPDYYPLNANSMILREACLWGQNNGKKQMHLGGAFTDELFAFKKQFTKKGICDYYVGKKIRNEEIYNELVNKRLKNGGILNNLYFPLYRG